MGTNEIVVLNQGVIGKAVGIRIEKEVNGVEMGILHDGTAFLSQRGLVRLFRLRVIDRGERFRPVLPMSDHHAVGREAAVETLDDT